ncbi:putative lipoprotein [Labilithrix luteola]|uniref:Putative lipoprotein n=1 Tax=Labilithrix luteola TaxID=1391654 RepID=A0A0K1Q9F1_9BACT|nr:DUF374 domain-containing protein [Labilithrix luteola]AKV02050.1 putative lipoprotein [Labilithrix luteola]
MVARGLRAVGGLLLGLLARVWLATLRLRLEIHPELEAVRDVPWVLSFFHGTQWPLLAWRRRRRTVVLVSLSKDGDIQARALGMLGMSVVRGSSSRGGARGLAALVRRLRAGATDAAFAVDGPRGPYGTVKPGASMAAKRAGGVLVPMGSAAMRAKVFTRAWDRFVLAWPFSTVSVVLGPPLDADAGDMETAAAIVAANVRARAILAPETASMVACSGISGPSSGKPKTD